MLTRTKNFVWMMLLTYIALVAVSGWRMIIVDGARFIAEHTKRHN